MKSSYWKKLFGIEVFKISYFFKWFLCKFFSVRLPKLKSQQHYWANRGTFYMQEIVESCYLDRELFFQNLLIDQLKTLEFNSLFEAGCGFGWSIKRVADEIPGKRIGGIDFSLPQLNNTKIHMGGYHPRICCGDICHMPFKDDVFDIGISVGVFMNIHPSKIKNALMEMIRVSKRYIIHLEYDENNTTKELREKRAFKTNIISHNYSKLYKELGKEIVCYKTFKDFGDSYNIYEAKIASTYKLWEDFEGAEKYILAVIKNY